MSDYASKRCVTLICGSSGTGKTSFALRYVANCQAKTRFFFDPDQEFAERLRTPGAGTACELDLATLRGCSVFDPLPIFGESTLDAVNFWAEYAWEWSEKIPGRKIVVLDELQRYSKPQAQPSKLSLLMEAGRRRGIELLLMTNRPSQINGVVWNQVTEIVCFQTQCEGAVDGLTRYGFDPAELPRLAPLHWIARNTMTGGELRGKLTF